MDLYAHLVDKSMDSLERLVEKPTTSLTPIWDKPNGDEKNCGEIAHHIYDEQDEDYDKDDDDDNDNLVNDALNITKRILPNSKSLGPLSLQYVSGSKYFGNRTTHERCIVCQLIESDSNRPLAKDLLGLGSDKLPTVSSEFSSVLDGDVSKVCEEISEAGRREIIGDTLHVSPRKSQLIIGKTPSPNEMYLLFGEVVSDGSCSQPLISWNNLRL